MSSVISGFERDLINKLQYKVSSKISHDALMFKTFKFFDLYNNLYLDKPDFIRAIAKCGVIIQTASINLIFDHYDTHQEGKIYYKEFIDNMFFRDSEPSIENNSFVSEKSQSRRAQPHEQIQKSRQQSLHSEDKSDRIKQSRIQEIYSQAETSEEILDLIRKNIRNEGISGLLNFANKLKATDPHKTHIISGFKLKQTLPYLGDDQIKRIIEELHPSPNGQINYAQLIYLLRGNVEKEREILIENTFKMLDCDKAGEFEIKKAIEAYHAENKDQFVRAVDFYCQFQGIDDGFFTDQDFRDLFEFISFAFASNQAFRDFILKGYYQEDARSDKSRRSRRQFDRESHNIQENMSQSQHNQNVNMNVDFRKNKQPTQFSAERDGVSEYHVAEEKERSPSHNSSQYHYEAPQEEHQRESSRHSSRQHSQVQISSNMKEVQLIILRIKKRLASKGTKGFLAFEKALKNADSDSDFCVNLEEFKKVIKEQRIDIANTESNIIFDVFDTDRQGLINYEDLLFTVKGETPANRHNLIERIWNKVSIGEQTTNFTALKRSMNLRCHPDIQNNKKYDEEIIRQLHETILMIQDLNSHPRSEDVTRDEFIEYLQNCSLTTPEDQIFESMAFNFWKIQSENKIEDQYAGSRKIFDMKNKGYMMDRHRYAVKGGTVTDHAPFGTFSEPTSYLTEQRKL